LKEVVDLYNQRDLDNKKSLTERRWPQAEVQENVNDEELGNLKLTPEEVDALVAFMETLTDGSSLPILAEQN
jgi:cytochrome c peroxidase